MTVKMTWRGRYRAAAFAGLCVVCLAAVLIPPDAVAAAGQAVEIQLPPGASNGQVALQGISCAASGGCSAIGIYPDSSGHLQAMHVTQAGGGWRQAAALQLPPDAAPNPSAIAEGLSCTRAGCAGVGFYAPVNGGEEPFAATSQHGSWHPAVAVKLPADAAAQTDGLLLGVTCTAPGFCTAVGRYDDQSHHTQGMVVTEAHGQWAQATKINPPQDAALDPVMILRSVTCGSPSRCTAVGTYTSASPGREAVSVTETAGTWGQAQRTILPQNAGGHPQATLNAVTCGGGWCVAGGNYRDSNGRAETMVLTGSWGHWSRATEIRLPLDAAPNPGATIDGLGCLAATLCIATGAYFPIGGNHIAMVAEDRGGSWRRAAPAQLPPNAATGPLASSQLDSVACPSIFWCAAAGGYADTGSQQQAMVVTVPL